MYVEACMLVLSRLAPAWQHRNLHRAAHPTMALKGKATDTPTPDQAAITKGHDARKSQANRHEPRCDDHLLDIVQLQARVHRHMPQRFDELVIAHAVLPWRHALHKDVG